MEEEVKKANKWTCKVCGEKQSTAKIYGQGRAQDCRKHVQKLNTIQGEREQMMAEKVIDADDGEEFDCYEDEVIDTEQLGQEDLTNERDQAGSKWEKFIEIDKKNEETFEEELWNGIPVTMDKKAIDNGTQKRKQPKKKIAKSSEELLPQKKRMKTQDLDNDEDENYSRRRNPQKRKELKDKSKSKWDVFNSEISPNKKLVSSNKLDGIPSSKSKSFMVKNDSSEKHSPCGSENVGSKSINSQAKNKGILCTSNTKTSSSKWSKFLGSNDANEEEEEGENVELYSRFVASEKPTSMDTNALSLECEVTNASDIPIPSFLMNARATRSEKEEDESTNSCQSSQDPSSTLSSKDLFTIDDDLGDEWWNV